MIKLIVCAMTIATTATVAAEPPLSIRVSPIQALAPTNLVIRTSVEPDARNRMIAIVAESDDYFRSSVIELQGDRAPKTTMFEFRSLPPGEYEVSAAVFGTDGRPRARARARVNVLESGSSR